MKSALSIVAFTVTFGVSVVLVGLLFGFPQARTDYTRKAKTTCFDKSRYNIERLINQDVRNGDLRDYKIRRLNSVSPDKMTISEYTEFVNDYVNKSESMDDSGMPSDFQASWRRHMTAWRDYSDFLNEHQDSSGEMSETEFNQSDREFNSEINRTWDQTLRIGRSYGASFDL